MRTYAWIVIIAGSLMVLVGITNKNTTTDEQQAQREFLFVGSCMTIVGVVMSLLKSRQAVALPKTKQVAQMPAKPPVTTLPEAITRAQTLTDRTGKYYVGEQTHCCLPSCNYAFQKGDAVQVDLLSDTVFCGTRYRRDRSSEIPCATNYATANPERSLSPEALLYEGEAKAVPPIRALIATNDESVAGVFARILERDGGTRIGTRSEQFLAKLLGDLEEYKPHLLWTSTLYLEQDTAADRLVEDLRRASEARWSKPVEELVLSKYESESGEREALRIQWIVQRLRALYPDMKIILFSNSRTPFTKKQVALMASDCFLGGYEQFNEIKSLIGKLLSQLN